jgi:hypothetical protein
MRMAGRAAVVLATIVLGAPETAGACSCVVFPLCESLWQPSRTPSSFFEATVDAVEPTAAGVAIVRLRDVRALRGAAADVVETATSEDACGYTFRIGTRYLIEATRRDDGRAETSICSSTAPVAEAREQIAYLERLAQPPPGARVFGQAIVAARIDADFGDTDRQPLPGVQLRLDGPVSRTLTTRADGTFVFDGLPPGSYKLTAQTDPRLALPAWIGDTFALPNGYACHESTVYLERPRRY